MLLEKWSVPVLCHESGPDSAKEGQFSMEYPKLEQCFLVPTNGKSFEE